MTLRAAFLALVLMGFAAAAPAEARAASDAPNLSSVAWAGPTPSLKALEGKTVVLLNYVTWCPKCNVWAPTMLKQFKEAAADKPVVILAVCNDEPSARAIPFLRNMGFGDGPNIFHGYSETLPKQLGGAENLWTFATIDPSAKYSAPLPCGQRSGDTYRLASTIADSPNIGEFSYVAKDQTPVVSQVAWAMETGNLVTDADLNKLGKVTPAERADMKKLLDKFVETNYAKMKTLADSSEVADKLAAADFAGLLMSFKARPEGKEAKTILMEMRKDKDMKPEFLAKLEYEKATATTNLELRLHLLLEASRKWGKTVYGAKAHAEFKSQGPTFAGGNVSD